ncbi:MAG: hypothetical protein H7Z38_23870 [Rubrivivax sp.]|nr:hypothetical protein [Pyrinomonadaceae bacterium]
MAEDSKSEEKVDVSATEKRWLIQNIALTLALFAPLLWAFVSIRNLYPIAASTMMMGGGSEGRRGGDYYVLRGETEGGETIDIPAIELTDALTGRIWGMVNAAVGNKSFTIPSPHPANAALIAVRDGIENVPRASRLPDLMRAWGAVYNSRLPPSSSRKLKAIRLDAYNWEGKTYADYGRYVETWRVEL